MLLRDKLNITQEEQEYLAEELHRRFSIMVRENGLKKNSEQVEKMLSYHVDNIDSFHIVYEQTLDIPSLEALLNVYREEREQQ